MMWTDVRGAGRVTNGEAVTTCIPKVQRGSGYWDHESLQRVGGFSKSPTSNLVSVLSLERNMFLRGRSEDPIALFLRSDGFCLPWGWSPKFLACSSRFFSIESQWPLGSSPLACSRAVTLDSVNWKTIFTQPRPTCPSSPYILPNRPEWSYSFL